MHTTRIFCSSLLGATLLASAARADEPSRAQALFEEGIGALTRGDYAIACAKLGESERIDPSVGTLVKLSECEEKLQKLVIARTYLTQAIELAEKKQDPRLDAVRARVARLDVMIPKLRIVRPAPGVVVTLDGAAVASDQFDFPFPIDIGAHQIVASAPQKITWRREVSTPSDHTSVVVIPALSDVPSAPTAAPIAATPESDAGARSESGWRGQKTTAYVLGGVGVVGVAIGTVFAAQASSKWSDAKDQCGSGCGPGSQAYATRDDASSAAKVATIGFVAGGALIAGAAVLFFTAPKERGIAVVPSVAAGGGGAVMRGEF